MAIEHVGVARHLRRRKPLRRGWGRRRRAASFVSLQENLLESGLHIGQRQVAALGCALRCHLPEQCRLHKRRRRTIHAGGDRGKIDVLQVAFGKLKHAHGVTVRRLVDVLHWAGGVHGQAELHLRAPIADRILVGRRRSHRRRSQRFHRPVTPIHEDVVELHLCHVLGQTRAGSSASRLRREINLIRGLGQIDVALNRPLIAHVIVRVACGLRDVHCLQIQGCHPGAAASHASGRLRSQQWPAV